MQDYLVFGPVPSRRSGRSLGINNIPTKHCSYSCVYCQLGYSKTVSPVRKEFFQPELIIKSLKDKINQNPDLLSKVDYITIVSGGEPTLDSNLYKLICLLKEFGKPVAILTNASLLWKEEVRDDLLNADLVSIKIDAVKENHWRFINMPNEYLNLNRIKDGIINFSKEFRGNLISETMLIDKIEYDFLKIGKFLKLIKNLQNCYISIPTRPPSFQWVHAAREQVINSAYQILSSELQNSKVELILGFEGSDFYFSGDIREDILSITAIHPIKESVLEKLLSKFNANWQIVENLLKDKQLIKILYNNENFYLRKINRNN